MVARLADRHAVRSVKVSGPIVAHDATTTTAATDKGEPDFAFLAAIYQGTMTVWGSISVNYKLLGPKTCTFTADASTTMTFYTGYNPDRVDISELLNGCDGKRYTVQLMERGDLSLPRGGVFISEETGDYINSTPYEMQGPSALRFDYYVPFDRGKVVFWNAG